MNFEKFEILKGRLGSYLHANVFELDQLDDNLDLPANKDVREVFRSELQEAIQTGVLPRDEFRTLTGFTFDSDADYTRFLSEIYAYLFEDGEYPEF